jgi:hypothetical protein
LLTTKAGVELARKRVSKELWAQEIVARLRRSASELKAEPLPVFEKDWWEIAKRKHWSQVYPEINHHTNFAVRGPIMKARDSAMLYAVTGEAEYASLTKKVLLHYQDYEFFAEHPDVGINWALWCGLALESYDLIHETISEVERAQIDDFFLRAMEGVKRNDEWWIANNPGGRHNNHFAWHKAFIGTYGLFYGAAHLVDYALHAPEGICELLEHGLLDDGLWFESSLNYHFAAVVAFVVMARNIANTNLAQGCEVFSDLWRTEFAGRTFRDCFLAPIKVLLPDETLPTIGDAYGHRMRLGTASCYFDLYDAYGDPELGWVVRDSPAPAEAMFLSKLPNCGSIPDIKTRHWPEHGYTMLRTQEGIDYWKGDGYTAFVSNDIDSVHSHHDKFDLIVYGRGVHLAVDPEALTTAEHAFSSHVQGELNRATLCHNTVMVDGLEQSSIDEKLEVVEFTDSAEVKSVTIRDAAGQVYPGVGMMRSVFATDDFVLDVFQLSSGKEHVYDYMYHSVDDNGTFRCDTLMTSCDLGQVPPWNWIHNAKSARFDEGWQVTTQQGDVTAFFSMAGNPGTEVVLCEFPYKDNFQRPPFPMLIARRKARSTVFASVIAAGGPGFRSPSPLCHEGKKDVIVKVGTREFVVPKLS